MGEVEKAIRAVIKEMPGTPRRIAEAAVRKVYRRSMSFPEWKAAALAEVQSVA